MENKVRTIKRKLLKELELYFGNDTKIVNHTKEVMSFAEKLLKKRGRGLAHSYSSDYSA